MIWIWTQVNILFHFLDTPLTADSYTQLLFPIGHTGLVKGTLVALRLWCWTTTSKWFTPVVVHVDWQWEAPTMSCLSLDMAVKGLRAKQLWNGKHGRTEHTCSHPLLWFLYVDMHLPDATWPVMREGKWKLAAIGCNWYFRVMIRFPRTCLGGWV